GHHVYRYDPATDKTSVFVTIPGKALPNGVTFNREFDTLWVSDWAGLSVPTLFQVPLKTDGTAGPVKAWKTTFGNGIFDGMGTDECGNLYVGNSGGDGEIIRFSPDGTQHTVVVKRSGETLHNFLWGRGNGWSETK